MTGTCNGTIFWEMNSSPGYTENLLPYNQTGDLWMGSKGQLQLNFFESVGMCNGAPLNVF